MPSKELHEVLHKTLGVPLFQEQAMKIAIIAVGFTPGEADQLRKAMATFRKTDKIGELGLKMIAGMVERGTKSHLQSVVLDRLKGLAIMVFQKVMQRVLHY